MAISKKNLPSYAKRHPVRKTWQAASKRTPGVKPGEVINPLGINNRKKAEDTRRVTFFLNKLISENGSLSELLKDDTKIKRVYAETLARAIYIQSLTESAYCGILLDRTEGKVPNPVELSGAGGAGVTFILDFSGKPDDTNGSS
jgi:hypothetical protein